MMASSSKVLAVPAEKLASFYGRTDFYSDPDRVYDALKIIRNYGRFYLRKWAEETEDIRQIIPCAIVRNETRFLCIKRAKKGRKDLRLRHTLLFGGHVDQEDSLDGQDHALYRCAQRELLEELGLSIAVSRSPIAVVVDIETASSRRHFGVVFECKISNDVVSVKKERDNKEFTHSDKNNDYILSDISELVEKKFDPWSQLLLTSDFARRNFQASYSSTPIQLPLRLMLR